MSNYSGFISNFTNSSRPSGNFYDLISALRTVNVTESPAYDCSYFYIGSILIQFTNVSNAIANLSTGVHIITFAQPFSATPYCVIVCPSSGGGKNAILTVINGSTTASSFGVNISQDTVGVSYIAIGPYTNS